MVNFLGLGLLVLFVPKLTDALGNYGESKLCFLFMWVFPVLSVACSVGF